MPIDEIETQLNSETVEHNNTVANFEALPSSYKNQIMPDSRVQSSTLSRPASNVSKIRLDQINNIASEAALHRREDVISVQGKGRGEGRSQSPDNSDGKPSVFKF